MMQIYIGGIDARLCVSTWRAAAVESALITRLWVVEAVPDHVYHFEVRRILCVCTGIFVPNAFRNGINSKPRMSGNVLDATPTSSRGKRNKIGRQCC